MALTSRTSYVARQTRITADWLNAVDDAMVNAPVWDVASKFGITPSASADQTSKFLEAVSAANSAGGARLSFSRPGYYLFDTETTSGGLETSAPITLDNLVVEGIPGVVLKSELPSPNSLFMPFGPAKPAGFANWSTYWAPNVSTVALKSGQAFSKGARVVTVNTAADAGAFAPGDVIYIRTGQTLNGRTTEPVAELNIVIDADPDTGDITLAYGLCNTYAQEYFISGTTGRTSTSVTANPAIFGVANLTNAVVRNVTFRNLRIEKDHHGMFANCDQVMGLTLQNIEYDVWDNVLAGNNLRFVHMQNVRGFARIAPEDSADQAWLAAFGFGSADSTVRDCLMDAPYGIPQFHAHEAVYNIRLLNCTLRGVAGITSDIDPISIRSRAHDILIQGNTIIHAGGSQPMIYVEDNCANIRVLDNTIGGQVGEGNTSLGVRINPTSTCVFRRNEMQDGLKVFATPGTERDDPPIHLPAARFVATTGTATSTTAGGGRWHVLSLPDDATTTISTVVRIPPDWAGGSARLRIRGTNMSSNSGDIRIQNLRTEASAGDSMSTTTANASQTVTAGSQDVVQEFTTASFFIPTAATDSYLVRISRLGNDDADTLDGAYGIIEAYLEPTNG